MSPDTGQPTPDSSNQVLMRVSNLVKEFPIKRGVFFKKQVGAVQAIVEQAENFVSGYEASERGQPGLLFQ